MLRVLPFLVALFGLAGGVAPALAPPAGAETLGVFLPPWRPDALERLVATGLPIAGFRQHGLIAVVVIDAPLGEVALRGTGLILLSATPDALCAPAPTLEPAT